MKIKFLLVIWIVVSRGASFQSGGLAPLSAGPRANWPN